MEKECYAGRLKFYSHKLDLEAFANYCAALQKVSCGRDDVALGLLAESIANSPPWTAISNAIVLGRLTPHPVLVVGGCVKPEQEAQITAQLQMLNSACARFKYVDYAQAQSDCEELGARLLKEFGREALKQFRFTAIPRGGLIILGILSYVLELEHEQIQLDHPPSTPCIVVDDCALSGGRFGLFLEQCPSEQVVFAPLYSHPGLRMAIVSESSRVIACLSACDVHDYGPEYLGENYAAWRTNWRDSERLRLKSKCPRYWYGLNEYLCFPWNDPKLHIFDAVTNDYLIGCNMLPPHLCLKNRLQGAVPAQIQMQPEAKGPLRPSDRVVYGQYNEQIFLVDIETSQSYGLTNAAADMWLAIVEHGNLRGALAAIWERYQVDEDVLWTDMQSFVYDMLRQGLLTYDGLTETSLTHILEKPVSA